jgi:26S proteasome regulatory subunit T3
MGDVAVESPASSLTPLHKSGALDNLANLDSLEGTGADGNDEYAALKRLQRHLEYVPSDESSCSNTDATQIHSVAGGIHQG